jgi:NADPH:quinone reductase-like Zn-dependent oxidoreductase
MKAVYVEHTGPPEVLTYGEVPEPQPRPNDVLIRVRATSLNRLDIFMREGSHGKPRHNILSTSGNVS